MKVIINNCYGGFNVSALAIKRLAELLGKKCYFFRHNYITNKYYEVQEKELDDKLLFYAFTVPNPNDFLREETDDNWPSIYKNLLIDPQHYDRHDPLLVQVVEELGEKANGSFSSLKVVEIPDGVEYTIDDKCTGFEIIREKHRTWC